MPRGYEPNPKKAERELVPYLDRLTQIQAEVVDRYVVEQSQSVNHHRPGDEKEFRLLLLALHVAAAHGDSEIFSEMLQGWLSTNLPQWPKGVFCQDINAPGRGATSDPEKMATASEAQRLRENGLGYYRIGKELGVDKDVARGLVEIAATQDRRRVQRECAIATWESIKRLIQQICA